MESPNALVSQITECEELLQSLSTDAARLLRSAKQNAALQEQQLSIVQETLEREVFSQSASQTDKGQSGQSPSEPAKQKELLARVKRETRELRMILEEREREIESMAKERALIQQELVRTRATVSKMRSSTSWRLTKPVRGARRALSKLKNS